jgi:hypothetical protein
VRISGNLGGGFPGLAWEADIRGGNLGNLEIKRLRY